MNKQERSPNIYPIIVGRDLAIAPACHIDNEATPIFAYRRGTPLAPC